MANRTIEDIILQEDRRGVSNLRPYLTEDFCHQAARFILDHLGTVFITTGFYILKASAPETDGPSGAVALGNALHRLGARVVYVSDEHTVPILDRIQNGYSEVLEFPITSDDASQQYADYLIGKYGPSLLISTERCGRTKTGRYLNMLGVDISPFTAKVDYLFYNHGASIGVGDGGNEIGMGNLSDYIPQFEKLPSEPADTRTTHLVIASVSNWGCYGLATALSILRGYNLLPSVEEESARIIETVKHGAVDGVLGKKENKVDGFTLEENGKVLEQLHHLLAEKVDLVGI